MWTDEDDMRAEVLIAWWLQNGRLGPDEVLIQPEGTFERAYRKDVLRVEGGDAGRGNPAQVHLSREGLYDMLPEAVFHQTGRKPGRRVEEAAGESERYRKEEKAARLFFLPLEQEYYRQRIWLEFDELKYWFNSARPENMAMLLQFWGIRPGLLGGEANRFLLSLMPQLHRLVGNPHTTAECLQILIGEPVRIETTEGRPVPLDEGLVSRLGTAELGVDWTLGDCCYCDEPALRVTVGPVAGEKLPSLLPGGHRQKQLTALYGFFFPAGTEVETAVLPAEAGFVLEAPAHQGRLGYTTIV